jgi:hypothetical protein
VNGIKHGKGSMEYGRRVTAGENNKSKQAEENVQNADTNAAKGKEHDVIDKLKHFDSKMKKLSQGRNSKDVGKDNPETNSELGSVHVKASGKREEEDHSTDYAFSEYENIYQGYFIGNNLANQGSVMNTMKQHPSIISRLDKRKVYPIQQVIAHEYRTNKKSDQIMEHYSDLEHFIRLDIYEKKLRIFKQQKHFAKKMMYEEDVYNKFDYSQIAQKLMIRNERLTKGSKLK